MDAAVEHKKKKMSPVSEEQLRDGTLQAINPAHRELIRQIGIRRQAEAEAICEESSDSDDNECDPPHGIVDSDSEDEDFPDIAMAIAKQKSQRRWRQHCRQHLTTVDTATADGGRAHQTTATAEGGRAHHALPVTLEESYDDDVLINDERWQDVDLQVTLDSGCCKHVLPADAAPGYEVVDSPSSMRGLGFMVGNGARVPNEGQMSLTSRPILDLGQSSSTPCSR